MFWLRRLSSGFQVAKHIYCTPQVYNIRYGTGFGGSSYYDSKLAQGPEAYTGVEKSYEEWKFVEKLLPPTHVPDCPADPSIEYPSGWTPQNLKPNLQYLVRRTKNHMIPVYLLIWRRGEKRITRIRRIEGNIWELEKQVGRYLKNKYPDKFILTHAHECTRTVTIRQDYLADVKEWLRKQGF